MKAFFLLWLTLPMLISQQAAAHCQIPCGVFDDGARFDLMMEHARTIEKAMNEINKKAEAKDYHTVARWTATKEEHAEKIQDIVAVYFMTQRIKANQSDYDAQLKAAHAILTAAMKTRQTLDTKNVEKLRDTIEAYRKIYFAKHGHTH